MTTSRTAQLPTSDEEGPVIDVAYMLETGEYREHAILAGDGIARLEATRRPSPTRSERRSEVTRGMAQGIIWIHARGR